MDDILEPISDFMEPAMETGRAFLTTPFEEYTVTEGFLLLFFILGFIWLCTRFFKGGL